MYSTGESCFVQDQLGQLGRRHEAGSFGIHTFSPILVTPARGSYGGG